MSWKDKFIRRRERKEKRDKWACTGVGAGKVEDNVLMPGVGVVPRSTMYPYSQPNVQAGHSYVGYTPPPLHRQHKGDAIQIGKYTVLAGGTRDLKAEDLAKADILVPLTQDIPLMTFGSAYRVVAAPLVDYGGVPENWGTFLKEVIVPLIEAEHLLLAYCVGSHGRTGTFLASLIAIMEPETADPIAAARERHCYKCVESRAQATAIFALRGEALPEKYDKEFTSVTYAGAAQWWEHNGVNYYGRHGGGMDFGV